MVSGALALLQPVALVQPVTLVQPGFGNLPVLLCLWRRAVPGRLSPAGLLPAVLVRPVAWNLNLLPVLLPGWFGLWHPVL